MDFDIPKSDLNVYREYCERAADLIVSAEAGVLIIDQRIKEPFEKVKKKSETVCKNACLPESELGYRVKHHASKCSQWLW